ncbi:uncharacterized protein ACWYII_022089 isoform 2-T2 [Salvelinus alpinus]
MNLHIAASRATASLSTIHTLLKFSSKEARLILNKRLCARVGNTEVLTEMLNSVPSSHLQMAVNKHSKTKQTPLYLAEISGQLDVCSSLLHLRTYSGAVLVIILTPRGEILRGAPDRGRLSVVLYVFHFLMIAPTVDFFKPSCLPIADSVFPAWCRSTILFLVSFDSSLVLAIVEFGV